jgi:hypothetical protein
MSTGAGGPRRTGRVARAATVGVLVLGVALLAGCAAGPNDVASVGTTQLAGFWLGLWHGVISPITFLVSLFNHHVNVYEVHNNGGWYNFGFMLGVSVIFGGGPGGSAARRRR